MESPTVNAESGCLKVVDTARPLGNGLDLPNLMADLARHYLERALAEADGNKTRAADLIGLPSYQTLTNWMSRYEVARAAEAQRQ